MAYLELEKTIEIDIFELAQEIIDNLMTEIEDFIVDFIEREESDDMARNLRIFLNDYLEEDN